MRLVCCFLPLFTYQKGLTCIFMPIALYICPSWGNAHYSVVHSQRISGHAGLLAWERPEIIATGVRGLAKEVLRLDERLKSRPPGPETAPLLRVVAEEEALNSGQTLAVPEGSSRQTSRETSSQKVPQTKLAEAKRRLPEEEVQDDDEDDLDGASPDTVVADTPRVMVT